MKRTVKYLVKSAVILALAAILCLGLASCGEKKLYNALEGMWYVDDASIILRFSVNNGSRYLSVIDDSLEVAGVTGIYTIDGENIIMNTTKAQYLGGTKNAVSISFVYDEKNDTLTVEYLGKTVNLKRWTLNLDEYPTFPDETDANTN